MIGAVSSSEDVDNLTVEIDEDDFIVGEEASQTFEDVQAQIDGIEENGTVELEGTYLGSGTPIKIEKSVTIQGKGEGATLDANNLASIMTITADNVVFKNIKFIQGFNQYRGYDDRLDGGGALTCRGNNVQIDNCQFMSCQAYSNSGAIYFTATNMNITNSIFDNCSSLVYQGNPVGGSILLSYGSSNVNIDSCVFRNLSTKYVTYYAGSAICSRASNVKIQNSNFTDFRAISMVAIYWNSYNNEVSNCNFVNLCPMTNDNHNRGAIEVYSSNNATISDCKFINMSGYSAKTALYNNGGLGSGIYVAMSNFVNITRCLFDDNAARCGVIYLDLSNNVTVQDCEITNSGVSRGILYITRCNYTNSFNNTFTNCRSTYGSGICVYSSPNTTIINNVFNNLNDNKVTIDVSRSNGTKIINSTFARETGNFEIVNSDVELIKRNAEIIFEDIICDYNAYGSYKVTLRDEITKEALKNKTLSFSVSDDLNTTFTLKTNDDGEAWWNISENYNLMKLDAGVYEVNVTVCQTDNYDGIKKIKLTVNKLNMSAEIECPVFYIGTSASFSINLITDFRLLEGETLKLYIDDEEIDNQTINSQELYFKPYTMKRLGNSTVKVVFGGNKNFLPYDKTIVVDVGKIPTNIAYLNSPNVSYGDESQFNVILKPYFGNITDGKLVFYVDDVEVGSVVGASKNYTMVVSHAGLHNLTVKFKDSANFTDANSTVEFLVTQSECRLFFDNASFNSADEKIIPVTFKDAKGRIIPNHNVVLYLNNNLIRYEGITDSEGIAYINITDLASGNYSCDAQYEGGDNYRHGFSDVHNIVIKIPTGISINAPQELTYGNNSIFNISVVPDSGSVNDGILKLFINDTEVKSANVKDGISNIEYKFENSGVFNITAKFTASTYFEDSNKTIQVTVNRMPTKLTVENVSFNQNDVKTLSAKLVDANGIELSKDIVFSIDPQDLTSGEYTYSASFLGDENYAESQSEERTIIVKYATRISIDNISSALSLRPVEIKTNLSDDTGILDYELSYFINDEQITGNFTPMKAGQYTLKVVYAGDKYHDATSKEMMFNVGDGRTSSSIEADSITAIFNDGKNLKITLKTANGTVLEGSVIAVNIAGKDMKLNVDKNGEAFLSINQVPKNYDVKITFEGNTYFKETSKDVKVVVNKATPKLTAAKKTFKAKTKTKKYSITLKNNKNQLMKKVKVTLKVKGKTYKATTNGKGKATFKIKNLKKKGTFKATVGFTGDKYYNKVSKKVKIVVKK